MPILENSEYIYLPCGRFYKSGKKTYGSVTSIISGFTPKKSTWVHDLAKVGTICHGQAAKEHIKVDIEEIMIWTIPQKEVYSAMRRFRCMWKKINRIINIKHVEIPVYYENGAIKYGGRVDVIFEKDGLIYLGDIKTGNWYDHYPMQLAAYYQAAKDIYNIDKAAILHCDISLDRNPNSIPAFIDFSKRDMENLLPEFNDRCIKYNKLYNAWRDTL